MSITLSNCTASIASAYGTAKTFSSISNAAEASASFAADPGFAVGDIVEVTSGWGRLNSRVCRIGSISGAGPYLCVLEDVDTSSTGNYPAGTGAGTMREITAWTEISQTKDITTSGGEQQFADVSTQDDDTERKMPTIRSASSIEIEVYDDPALAFYPTVLAASDNATVVAMRLFFRKGGSYLYANSYWSMQEVPTIAKNEPLKSKISCSYASRSIRYAS